MPLGLALSAATHGMAFGLWPISWVVLSAVFFYNLSVESGDFDVIRRSLARLTSDRRIQVLLVAFCFGALIEGIAGFGAPVAITAAMLAGLGFEPITAAVLALVANTAPVAFGSLGIPVTTLGALIAPILGRDVQSTTLALSAMVGRQLPFFSVLIPAYLVVLLCGWKRMIEVLPAVLPPASASRSCSSSSPTTSVPNSPTRWRRWRRWRRSRSLLRVWRPRERRGLTTRRSRTERMPAAPRHARPRRPRVRHVRACSWSSCSSARSGNFAGLRQMKPPANVTALLRCGQTGNALVPGPLVAVPLPGSSQDFRFPVWDLHVARVFDHGRATRGFPSSDASRPSSLRRRRTR